MPGPIVRAMMKSMMPVVAALIAGCTDLPTFVPQDRTIASIRISGCAAVAVRSTCEMTARAWDGNGTELSNPPLVWRSSRPGVASVTGSGRTATITGIVTGQSVISASDGAQRTSDSVTVHVAPLKQ